jgi:hypothetical protein
MKIRSAVLELQHVDRRRLDEAIRHIYFVTFYCEVTKE